MPTATGPDCSNSLKMAVIDLSLKPSLGSRAVDL